MYLAQARFIFLPAVQSQRRSRLIALFLAAVLLGSCSIFNPTPVSTRFAERPDPPPQVYVIGKDDLLNIIVWREPQLSGKVLVASDGTITLPLAPSVPAAGLTCKELQKELARRLDKFTRAPNITVRVEEPRSRVFYALGEVHTPGMFQMHSDEVLSQALAQAGGFTDYADPGAIKILRHTSVKDIEITINFNRVASGNDLQADIPLKPGDTITVP
jgi:polysaccharide export outer membrane protein